MDTCVCISDTVSFCGFYYGTLYHILYLDAFFETFADKNMGEYYGAAEPYMSGIYTHRPESFYCWNYADTWG